MFYILFDTQNVLTHSASNFVIQMEAYLVTLISSDACDFIASNDIRP